VSGRERVRKKERTGKKKREEEGELNRYLFSQVITRLTVIRAYHVR